MPPPPNVRYASLDVQPLESRLAPSASPAGSETFDSTPTGSLPSGWSQWSNNGSAPFAVSAARSLSSPNGLAVASGIISGLAARSWVNAAAPADVRVSAAVYLDTLIPAQVFARGSGLGTATPTYYAVSITRGLQAQLVRVTDGVSTVLATITSPDWFSNRWAQVTLDVEGNTLRAQVYRPDTGQYLNADRVWQASPGWAMQVQDAAISGAGQVGVGRPASYAGTVNFDDFNVALPGVTEPFDQTAAGTLPAGWAQWSSAGDAPFAVAAGTAVSTPNGLALTATFSNTAARAWPTGYSGTDLQASADVYVNSIIPAQVFARGTNLSGAAPSYYAASVTRGLQVQLVRVQDGVTTVLGQLNSTNWMNQVWVRVTLAVHGGTLQAQVYRIDTGMYLTEAGNWQPDQARALTATDTALAGPGLAGLARPASYAGAVTFDDFAVTPASGDSVAPSVTVTAPGANANLSGTVTVRAIAADNVGVVRTVLLVDGGTRATGTIAPYQWSLDTTTIANGTHTIAVLAYDAAGNSGAASVTVTVQNANALPQPSIPQHLPGIRVAELAYSGTPIDATATALLKNDVDLVVSDPRNVAAIAAVAPTTPQLIYTNLSTLYGSLLTDWNTYADANGTSREAAFYHVAAATPYSGSSPSSQPVEWFWSVALGSGTSWTDLTAAARRTAAGGVTFGGVGQSVVVGYPELFRQVNVALLSPPGSGWQGTVEYPTQLDAAGNPTAWAALNLLTDTTAGLHRSGQLLFDPPADWKPASINGSARLYYVRFRTTSAGPAPVAASVLAEDYTNAGNGNSGTVPAFDYAADANHDGYLSNAEYPHAAAGKTARFAYQGRALYGSYGEMRFATQPGSPAFTSWAVNSLTGTLGQYPQAAGLFLDNSNAVAPVTAAGVVETVASYATDYAALVNAVAHAVAPHWLLSNTAGGGAVADPLMSHATGYFEEFALRPLSGSYHQFEDLAALVAGRASLQTPPPFAVLDALPAGGSPTDARTQIATLAEYYLLADPTRTFLDPFGGDAPATSWAQHFFGALTYDVGKPAGDRYVFARGADPTDSSKTYYVYARPYANALVLYKPLSGTANGSANGTTADGTATTYALGGSYRALGADGTSGPVVTGVTLRNGEGAILIKA
jgi:hypothetical protein